MDCPCACPRVSPCSLLGKFFGKKQPWSDAWPQALGLAPRFVCQHGHGCTLRMLCVNLEPSGDRWDLELTSPPHAPLHGVGSPRHRSLTLGSTPASHPAGQGWPIAASSCRYRVRGGRRFGDSRAGDTWAPMLLAEHMLCFAALFPRGVLSQPLVAGVGWERMEQGTN